MKTIVTFLYDHWAPKPVNELEVGDLISQGGKVTTVAALPYAEGGKTHIPGEPYDSGPIKLLVGEFADGMEHVMMAMELVGSELAEFDDGTALITDLEAGHGPVYSPRLPVSELEAFCAEHIERYQAFYDANEDAIESRQTVTLEPWWSQAQQ
ncbi:hypothetical protein ACFQDN_21770 [Pseudomonas asuensis]|uniref:DUF4265 domain-containing protein n=1 Tax=Pseudomonas asuensis TaxID=1825787 RepID=A0ABQ2H153_9PSED|nr:hypothetical protein [Pseudomonas asuensis]GGM25182.1 hypothetical protein GCM10009425_40000 [Pseudomonas asuensis]